MIMLWKRRSTYFKCPACGYETEDLSAQDREPVTCPQCKTTVERRTAFMPSLFVGLVSGLLLGGTAFAVFALTQARPVYAILAAGFIVFVLAWPLSPWLRKLTSRWTKV